MTRFLKSRIVWLAVIILGVGVVFGYGLWHDTLLSRTLSALHDSMGKADQLRQAILSRGNAAPLLFVVLQALQVIIAPIPGEASGILGGYLFGTIPGFLYSTIGLTIGSWIAFVLARLMSDLIRRRLEEARIYQRFNHLICGGDFVVPFILFLLPGFPKDSLSYLLGISHMPLPVFLFITAVGRMPGTLMLSLQGAEVSQGNLLRIGLLLGLSLLIALPTMIWRKSLLHWLGRRNHQNHPPTSGGCNGS